jgi:hypothetical protein
MAATKQIVCLANSRKLSGRCIAGIELAANGNPLGWIRPVSDREHEEVSEHERQYQDGSDPQVMDVINVPLLSAQPKGYQQENWLLDPDQYWTRQKCLPVVDLARLVTTMPALWINGQHTKNGQNDLIPLSQIVGIDSSLCLIRVPGLALRVFAPGHAFGNFKRRVQGQFQFNGTSYWLWVTDPKVERDFLAKANGEYSMDACYLTISLGEAFNDAVYKLIAAVIPLS